MIKKKMHPQIASAFVQAQSSPDEVVPRLVVGNAQVTSLPLSAMVGPCRDLGYIELPRLTFTADPIGYFTLGCLLISSARHASVEKQRVDQIALQRTVNSGISTMVLKVWEFDSDLDAVKAPENSVIELERDIFWLSPLSNFKLDESDSPVAGIIRRQVSGLPLDEGVPCDSSAVYLSVSTRGAIALGKTLILFAISADSEFVQFEQIAHCGGVGRMSYEIECLMSQSFASDALFTN